MGEFHSAVRFASERDRQIYMRATKVDKEGQGAFEGPTGKFWLDVDPDGGANIVIEYIDGVVFVEAYGTVQGADDRQSALLAKFQEWDEARRHRTGEIPVQEVEPAVGRAAVPVIPIVEITAEAMTQLIETRAKSVTTIEVYGLVNDEAVSEIVALIERSPLVTGASVVEVR